MLRPSHLMILALTAAALYIYALASDSTLLALLAILLIVFEAVPATFWN